MRSRFKVDANQFFWRGQNKGCAVCTFCVKAILITKARNEPLITVGSAPLDMMEFRGVVLGQLGESKSQTEKVTVQRPIHTAIRYGVSQALLQAVALIQGKTITKEKLIKL